MAAAPGGGQPVSPLAVFWGDDVPLIGPVGGKAALAPPSCCSWATLARPWVLFPLFCALTLVNRILLTIQFSYTDYPVFVNLYWSGVTAVIFRVVWLLRRRVTPAAAPAVLPPQWVFWALAVVYSVNNILESVALSKLEQYGALQVLLSQSRIPLSMILTRVFFWGRSYAPSQYVGAAVVLLGIFVTLVPDLDRQTAPGADVLLGIGLFSGHCVLAALYVAVQEKLLSKYSLDVFYILGANQWQGFLVTLVLLVPQALLAGVTASDIGANIERGADCQFGKTPAGELQPCTGAPYATHAFILTNILWTIAAAFVIATLGANSFQLAATATVPLNVLVYTIPGMPAYRAVTLWDAVGLTLVLLGIVAFQFTASIVRACCSCCCRRCRRGAGSLLRRGGGTDNCSDDLCIELADKSVADGEPGAPASPGMERRYGSYTALQLSGGSPQSQQGGPGGAFSTGPAASGEAVPPPSSNPAAVLADRL